MGSIAWLSKSLFGTCENGKEFVDHVKLVVVLYAPLCLGVFILQKNFVETPNGFIITNQFVYILVGTPKPLCITILLLVGRWRRVAPVSHLIYPHC
jgi:hypothetical protein